MLKETNMRYKKFDNETFCHPSFVFYHFHQVDFCAWNLCVSLAIYWVSFRILIAPYKNDVARYGHGGNDGGRDTYNHELSLRLSLSL